MNGSSRHRSRRTCTTGAGVALARLTVVALACGVTALSAGSGAGNGGMRLADLDRRRLAATTGDSCCRYRQCRCTGTAHGVSLRCSTVPFSRRPAPVGGLRIENVPAILSAIGGPRDDIVVVRLGAAPGVLHAERVLPELLASAGWSGSVRFLKWESPEDDEMLNVLRGAGAGDVLLILADGALRSNPSWVSFLEERITGVCTAPVWFIATPSVIGQTPGPHALTDDSDPAALAAGPRHLPCSRTGSRQSFEPPSLYGRAEMTPNGPVLRLPKRPGQRWSRTRVAVGLTRFIHSQGMLAWALAMAGGFTSLLLLHAWDAGTGATGRRTARTTVAPSTHSLPLN